jgi:hypothetical protein
MNLVHESARFESEDSLLKRHDRAVGALESFHTVVRIQPDKYLSQPLTVAQEGEMAGV